MGEKIILADSHPDVRSALRLLLEEIPDITIVAEADTREALWNSVKAAGVNLVLLEWELPGSRPLDLLASLKEKNPSLSIIVLSSQNGMREAALAAGARDFICKSEPPVKLLQALDNYFKLKNQTDISSVNKT